MEEPPAQVSSSTALLQAAEALCKPENPSEPLAASSDWLLDLSFDLHKTGRQRIAFGSGEERKYYPEDPGHSKMGVMHALNTHKGDTPNPSYFPPPVDQLQKPISKKGYGIGGLSARRFPTIASVHEKRPEPGAYQRVHMRPSRPRPDDVHHPLLRRQCRVAFGSAANTKRFEPPANRGIPGPGTYSLAHAGPCSSPVAAKEAFGGRRCILPTTVTICRFTEGEECAECGQEQRYDYYRTIKPLAPGGLDHGVLCRSCYCTAWNGHGGERWGGRKDLEERFEKARHCSFKHDHQGLPILITKAAGKDIEKLTRKEVLLFKYFKDSCPPEVKVAPA